MNSNNRNSHNEANQWFGILLSGNCSPKTLDEFKRWLTSSSENEHEFRQIESTWRKVSYAINIESTFENKVPHKVPQKQTKRRNTALYAFATAASIAVLVFFTNISGLWWSDKPVEQYVKNVNSPARIITTGKGDIQKFTLEDGTEMWLGGSAKVVFVQTQTGRHIDILNGDAHFDVTPNLSKPFVVTTEDLKVTVVGTSFGILQTPSKATVSLKEGKVAITDGIRSLELRAGERVSFASDGFSSIETFDVKSTSIDWRNRQFNLSNVPLADLVSIVNRYSQMNIVLERPEELISVKVTAAFNIKMASQLINSLSVSHNLTVETGNDGFVYLSKKKAASE